MYRILTFNTGKLDKDTKFTTPLNRQRLWYRQGNSCGALHGRSGGLSRSRCRRNKRSHDEIVQCQERLWRSPENDRRYVHGNVLINSLIVRQGVLDTRVIYTKKVLSINSPIS